MQFLKATITTFTLLFNSVMWAQSGNELYRPEIHFSPNENWINDPNGLVFYNGVYHLFYQYNPFGELWGNMSWGHATSTDLLQWEEQPVAIPYEDGIMAFSGSVVVDWLNTSGFGTINKPPLVAIYTGFNPATGIQDQRIAYSTDEGFTWVKYDLNPVININSSEFRDPKVFWHSPTNSWIMVVALGNEKKIRFYRSNDLLDWDFLQDFGPVGNTTGSWECPDLFALPLDGNTNNMRWVLALSVAPGASQYFIGDFDGSNFTWDNSQLPTGILFDDFEAGNYSNWTVEGNAFDQFPATGTLPNQQNVSGYLGNRLINTFNNGDITQGRLTSNDFIIEKDYLCFLIGGGNHPEGTYFKLILNSTNEVVHSATGLNNELLKWNDWNVASYFNQSVHLEVIDSVTGGWGHINIDHIIQTDKPFTNSDMGVVDYGKDFYALQSFSDIPATDGRRIWLAWMNNWSYAGNVPTDPWRGIMSLPREVRLKTINDEIYLVQKPIYELKNVRSDSLVFANETLVNIQSELESVSNNIFELKGKLANFVTGSFDLILKKSGTEETKITFDADNQNILFNRSNSGDLTWHQLFSDIQIAPLNTEDSALYFNLIVDNCSVELFVNDGQTIFSNQIFPDSTSNKIELSSDLSSLIFEEFTIYSLNPNIDTSSSEPEVVQPLDIKVYPNPTGFSKEIIIEVSGLQNEILNYTVYSLLGQNIYQTKSSQERTSIPRKVLPVSGIYLLVVEIEENSILKKLIVN